MAIIICILLAGILIVLLFGQEAAKTAVVVVGTIGLIGVGLVCLVVVFNEANIASRETARVEARKAADKVCPRDFDYSMPLELGKILEPGCYVSSVTTGRAPVVPKADVAGRGN
jgi:hypothetical protein